MQKTRTKNIKPVNFYDALYMVDFSKFGRVLWIWAFLSIYRRKLGLSYFGIKIQWMNVFDLCFLLKWTI